MRNVALTRKHTRVLAAVAAAEAADEAPSLTRIAERVPLRPDLVEVLASDLSAHGLVRWSGALPIDEDLHLPGPELRVTGDGHRLLAGAGVA